MQQSLLEKLSELVRQHEELGANLNDPELMNQAQKYQAVSREYAQLQPIVDLFANYQATVNDLQSAKEMLQEAEDNEMRVFAAEEVKTLQQQLEQYDSELKILLLPKDPNDDKNIFLEIRAGTGGDEAAIFVGDLLKMYMRY